MVKTAEIQILRDTAAKLGAASYTGAWLADVLPEIEHLIGMDYPIETTIPTPNRAAQIARETLTNATQTAEAMIKDAHSEADRITRTARERAQTDRQTAREDLRRLIDRFRDDI